MENIAKILITTLTDDGLAGPHYQLFSAASYLRLVDWTRLSIAPTFEVHPRIVKFRPYRTSASRDLIVFGRLTTGALSPSMGAKCSQDSVSPK